MPPVTTVTVSQAESGQKLLQFLERRLSLEGVTIPRGALQRWVRKGHVRVDGGRKKPFDRIHAGQTVRIPPYNAPGDLPEETGGQNAPPPKQPPLPALDIIHEDPELLVISKPAGLPAHSGTGHDDSVATRLAATFAQAAFRPSLIHRLDKNTSGLLLAAKTYAALRRYNDLVASGGMSKHYLAWVSGEWEDSSPSLLEDRMEKKGAPGGQKVQTGSGKLARARVTPLLDRGDTTLLAIELITGRTHQIRVQLADRAHPIIGDGKYGTYAPCGMLLHAFHVQLEHQRFSLPPDWPAPYDVSEQILHTYKP